VSDAASHAAARYAMFDIAETWTPEPAMPRGCRTRAASASPRFSASCCAYRQNEVSRRSRHADAAKRHAAPDVHAKYVTRRPGAARGYRPDARARRAAENKAAGGSVVRVCRRVLPPRTVTAFAACRLPFARRPGRGLLPRRIAACSRARPEQTQSAAAMLMRISRRRVCRCRRGSTDSESATSADGVNVSLNACRLSASRPA